MAVEPLPAAQSVSFRAPPPSPVAPGRRSPFSNEDVLTEYLEQSLKVPDLILPDRVFPKQKSAQNPQKVDLQDLISPEKDSVGEISEMVAQTGCLEVVNHGIPRDLIRLVLFLSAGIFEIPTEKKKAATRSTERRYGFEEAHGEEENGDQSEEFLWCGDEGMRSEMEGIWPFGYSNFSGSTNFHVYSKKGWFSFCPNEDSIVITIGDRLQVWSGGEYKHVIGHPIFKDEAEKCISMGFLFCPPNLKNTVKDDKSVTITLSQQIIFAVLITLVYQFSFYIYHMWKRKTEKKRFYSTGFCVCQCVRVEKKMDDKFETVKKEDDDLPEFTLSEVLQMEKSFKKLKDTPIGQELYEELSVKFSSSPYRSEKPPIKWEQVQVWFQNKQTALSAEVVPSSADEPKVESKAVITEKRTKAPTISASEAAKVLPDLIFEAQSAKDNAWFDVASFLSYRVLHSGELVVRVRFSGFGKDEDEWVSVKRAVRERSIPLENSECHKVDIGDLMLCYREAEHNALYCDARVTEIERKPHGGNQCTCIFTVRYEDDYSEVVFSC
ncbi:2-oxoglutarate (2OG) and Fe(II)-dependent oxygenase superfamily protein [Striga asiatica]|uniref:2-oxoglutarate (2OG) and Fe(II)-dependent oxygenase superfamily protein n=1 Tax=Striga asiatica TaxID=4170 RepID=A0A5A7R3S1_STRAF|nr:2-oxoglutarate (2OG) and Fe(II)-dependent oxygenase superfamily protein [Striga asiatica]